MSNLKLNYINLILKKLKMPFTSEEISTKIYNFNVYILVDYFEYKDKEKKEYKKEDKKEDKKEYDLIFDIDL